MATNKTNKTNSNNPTAALTRVLTRLDQVHPSEVPVKAISVTEGDMALVGMAPAPRLQLRDRTTCQHPRSPTSNTNNITEKGVQRVADTILRWRCRVRSPHSTAILGRTAMHPRHRSILTRASLGTMTTMAATDSIHPARHHPCRPALRLLVAGAFLIVGIMEVEDSLIVRLARPSVQSLINLLRITR